MRENNGVAHSIWDSLPRPILALAPMEDVTDTVFRQLIAEWSAPDLYFTEFVNVDGMCSPGRKAVIHRLKHTPKEHPLIAQIWGLKPVNFETAAHDIAEMDFDGIDINMGCPVKKIVKTGACSALIDNPTLASEIIHATKAGAGDLPVSVKTRIGFRTRKTVEWTRYVLDHDVAALTVHGRISKDMSDVPADWDAIAEVTALRDEMAIPTPILGNGDVVSREQALRYCEKYGVDGVMIGRGIFQDPFLFSSASEPDFDSRPQDEKHALLKQHISLYRDTWGDYRNFNVMKKFVKVYVRGFNGASRFREELMNAQSYDEMIDLLS